MVNLVAVQNPAPSGAFPPSSDSGSNAVSACTTVTFDDFYTLYPRKVAKLAARKAWARIDAAQHVAILTALTAWRQVWRDKDHEYIPHPASWLNGERWEDELPAGFAVKPRQTAQTCPPRVEQQDKARTPLPEHVRALLERLKAKL